MVWVLLLTWLVACSDGPAEQQSPSPDVASAGPDLPAQEIQADAAQDTADDTDPPDVPGLSTDPAVLSLSPDEGPTGGLTTVTIAGLHLSGVSEVRFGESPGLGLMVLSDTEVQVQTPPRPPGLVDVTVITPGKPDVVVPMGYRYVAEVTVTKVEPDDGLAVGGTEVTVHGTGFQPGTHFVFGTKLAIGALVVDDQTAVMRTPPGPAGKVTVTAATPDGVGWLAKAFRYRAAPTLQRVEPALGPLSGGKITLFGKDLQRDGGKVQLVRPGQTVTAAILTGDGWQIQAMVPPTTTPEVWDVRFVHQDGVTTLAQAYATRDPAANPAAQLVIVSPPAQPASPLAPVSIGLQGASVAGQDLDKAQIRFGNLPAQLLDVQAHPGLGATLRVLPPAPVGQLPQTVGVEVQIGPATLTKLNAFQYLPPIAQIVAVTPKTLPTQGGKPLQVEVSHASGHGGVVGVQVGALPSTQVQAAPIGSGSGVQVQAMTPQGPPGKADVRVLFADGTVAVAPGAVELDTTPFMAAIVPALGSQAGGNVVHAVGAGLAGLTKLELGGKPAKNLEIVDAGLARLVTPRGNPGVVDATGFLSGGKTITQTRAYTFFDPQSLELGTWGPPIDGAVNVTVLRKGKVAPIQGALVTIGNGALMGVTDDRGQVTLTSPGLVGPLDVHASKPGYTAGSVVAVAVENVTIRLAESPPMADGNGNGPPPEQPVPPPDGEITGTVLNAEKYTQLPAGSCQDQPAVGGNCKPCQTQADCVLGMACVSLSTPKVALLDPADVEPPLPGEATPTTGAKFCAAACTSANDCPGGFECRLIGPSLEVAQPRCVPQIGTPQIRCESASGSIFGGAPQSPNGGIVGKNKHFHVMATPGDTAVVCKSGYVDKKSGQFVPLAMGLVRKLFVFPGQKLTNVNLYIDTPLDRRMRVRMDALPMGPDATGQRALTAGLDLGAEGYVPLGQVTTYAQVDTLEFTRQPALSLFTGDNADVRYELYGGVGGPYGGAPSSMGVATGVDPRGLDRFAFWKAGAKAPEETDEAAGTLHAFDQAGSLKVAVGAAGRIVHWTGGGFTQQPSPTSRDLRAVWLAAGAKDGWIGGEDGVLLRWGATGWKAWPEGVSSDVVALHGRQPDDVWLLGADDQLRHWNGKQWSLVAGPWPPAEEPTQPQWGPPPGGVPKHLRAIWHLPDGDLLLAGDEGTFYRGLVGSDGNLTFIKLTSGTTAHLRALYAEGDGDVWIAGDRGYLAHWDGAAVTVLTTGTIRPLYAIRSHAGGFPLHVVGAQGTWLRVESMGQVTDVSVPLLRVDLRGLLTTYDGGVVAGGLPVLVMGPYLEMPYFTKPTGTKEMGLEVAWTALPGVTPTLNLVRIADVTYTTRWEMFVRGAVMTVPLPDFQALADFNPLPKGDLHIRLWRIYAPGLLDIDAFNSKGLSQWKWTSWAYNVHHLDGQIAFDPLNPLPIPPGTPTPSPFPP